MLKKKIKNEPDPTELKVEKFLSKAWVIIRKEGKRLVKWTFFYTPENKMNATLHIVDIIAILYITLRIMKI